LSAIVSSCLVFMALLFPPLWANVILTGTVVVGSFFVLRLKKPFLILVLLFISVIHVFQHNVI
jgi:hypothetical protein